MLGSVEDHVPGRHLLYVHGDDSLAVLQQAGATHVLGNRVRFIRKSYSHLGDSTFDVQLRQPQRQLEELLLTQTVQLFEDGRFGVWAFTPPTEHGAAP